MIHVDQSNKIERLEQATILAFANKLQCSVLIPAVVKRETFAMLINNGKSRKSACMWMFSAGVFLLFKPHLTGIIKRNELIVIDTEYTGQDNNIRSMLLRHCWKSSLNLRPEMISFAQIGKTSRAHLLAYSVQQGTVKPDRQLKFKEFWESL